jgi:hypothetical protein
VRAAAAHGHKGQSDDHPDESTAHHIIFTRRMAPEFLPAVGSPGLRQIAVLRRIAWGMINRRPHGIRTRGCDAAAGYLECEKRLCSGLRRSVEALDGSQGQPGEFRCRGDRFS